MPDFEPDLEALRDFYRMEWLADGYPGRRNDDGSVTPHPIYGVYVIFDYVAQFRATRRPALREAVGIVARAAVARMDMWQGTLVFRYPGDLAVGRAVADHYSGLTQAYYAVALFQAYQTTGDELYRDAAELAFRSLMVPAEEGGVLYRWRDNVAIAEVPAAPRDMILNGWQSALISVHRYADLSGSNTADDLFRQSSATMARLLPLFDSRPLRNSRYALAGPIEARLSFSGVGRLLLSDVRVRIPTDGVFEVPAGRLSRWQTHLDPDDVTIEGASLRPRGDSVRMNLILSRISHPARNELRLTVDTRRRATLELSVLTGRYAPLSASEVDRSWRSAARLEVAPGRHQVRMPIPWRVADLVAYPTNFLKVLEGRHTNVYHAIHIQRLDELHEATGEPIFAEFADRWRSDICAWSEMELYDGLSVRSYWTPGDSVVDPERLC
jgi:hypothetical protein